MNYIINKNFGIALCHYYMQAVDTKRNISKANKFLEFLSEKFLPNMTELLTTAENLQRIDSTSKCTEALRIIVNMTVHHTCSWLKSVLDLPHMNCSSFPVVELKSVAYRLRAWSLSKKLFNSLYANVNGTKPDGYSCKWATQTICEKLTILDEVQTECCN